MDVEAAYVRWVSRNCRHPWGVSVHLGAIREALPLTKRTTEKVSSHFPVPKRQVKQAYFVNVKLSLSTALVAHAHTLCFQKVFSNSAKSMFGFQELYRAPHPSLIVSESNVVQQDLRHVGITGRAALIAGSVQISSFAITTTLRA